MLHNCSFVKSSGGLKKGVLRFYYTIKSRYKPTFSFEMRRSWVPGMKIRPDYYMDTYIICARQLFHIFWMTGVQYGKSASKPTPTNRKRTDGGPLANIPHLLDVGGGAGPVWEIHQLAHAYKSPQDRWWAPGNYPTSFRGRGSDMGNPPASPRLQIATGPMVGPWQLPHIF